MTSNRTAARTKAETNAAEDGAQGALLCDGGRSKTGDVVRFRRVRIRRNLLLSGSDGNGSGVASRR
jgi:hypothetical protein